MNLTPTTINQKPKVTQAQGSSKLTEKQLTGVFYGLMAASLFFPLAIVVALVAAHVKSGDDNLTTDLAKCHIRFQIRTIWWSFLWVTLSVILAFALIGYLTIIVATVWFVYRTAKGAYYLYEDRAI